MPPRFGVNLKVAGKSKTVKLSKSGKATVRVVTPWRTKAGKKSVKVTYAGDAYVAKGTAKTTSIKVTR